MEIPGLKCHQHYRKISHIFYSKQSSDTVIIVLKDVDVTLLTVELRGIAALILPVTVFESILMPTQYSLVSISFLS